MKEDKILKEMIWTKIEEMKEEEGMKQDKECLKV